MATRRSIPAGAPCWIDLMTPDQGATIFFYTSLFGWDAEEPNPQFGNYANFLRDGQRIAGCAPAGDDRPDARCWSVYVAVEDATKAVEVAAAAGATAVVPPMPVGDLGVMAVVVSPEGTPVGMWQPGTHQGITVLGEAGSPAWFEAHVGDYPAAVEFFRSTFGWTASDMPVAGGARYARMDLDGQPAAGIADGAADGTAGLWMVYFTVPDCAATAHAALSYGGEVIEEPKQTAWGEVAVIEDPNGARLVIVGGR